MVESLALLSFQRWIFQAFAMSLTALVIPGFRVTNVFGPLLTVIALAFLNAHLWSAALFFHIPDSITTQALLLLLVNGLLFWVIIKLLPGIEVTGLLPALIAPVVFTVLSVLVETYGKEIDWSQLYTGTVDFFAHLKGYFMTVEGESVTP